MIKVIDKGPHHLAIFKPSNICVVGGFGVKRPTLLDMVHEKFGKNVFPVHRLDKGTSGVILFARSLFAKLAIENAFKKRLVKKTYLAMVELQPSFKKIDVRSKLKRINLSSTHKNICKQIIHDDGEYAHTVFRSLGTIYEKYYLIEARPITGRMHQIRAHLSHLGLPIVGDRLYGAKTDLAENQIALCAVSISLPAPKGGFINVDLLKDKTDILHLFTAQLAWIGKNFAQDL